MSTTPSFPIELKPDEQVNVIVQVMDDETRRWILESPRLGVTCPTAFLRASASSMRMLKKALKEESHKEGSR